MSEVEELPLKKALNLVRGVGVEGVEESMQSQAAAVNPPHVLICTPSLGGYPALEYQVSLLETITRCAAMGLIVDAAFG